MKAVVLGDIGWRELYHLGDEAMTEAAIAQLQQRGVDPILIAGNPKVSEELYDVRAVARVGFWSKEGTPEHRKRLKALHERLDGPAESYTDIVRAVRDADFAVIAGGGNLNDELPSHVYERLALKRMAEHFSKPLIVTSQTVGPNLSGEMREAVSEIVEYASLVGCRDYTSVGLVRSLVDDRCKVFRQVDDASMLIPTLEDEREAQRVLAEFSDDGPFAIGAFTSHVGTTDFDKPQYMEALTRVCSEVSVRANVNVLLTSHVGSFNEENARDDQLVHSSVEKESTARPGRVRALPMLKAGTVIALTRHATVSFSTRYHPAVFAMAAGVPHVGLIQSYYSSVKVRGALSNYGLSRCGIPFIDTDDIVQAVVDCRDEAYRISPIQQKAHAAHLAYQGAWWDFVCDFGLERLEPGGAMPFFKQPAQYFADMQWSVRAEAQLPLFEALSRSRL